DGVPPRHLTGRHRRSDHADRPRAGSDACYRMTSHRRPTRFALLAGLMLAALTVAGCASEGPSDETSDVFQAAPWQSAESLQYRVLRSDGEVIGAGTLSSGAQDGQLALRQEYTEAETPEGAEPIVDEVTVFVNPSTFRPAGGERVARGRDDDGEPTYDRWSWTYGTDEDGEPTVTIEHFDAEDDDDPSEDTLELREHYYDNESSLWLWRSIDLTEEYDANYVSVNPMEASRQTVNLRVPQTEMVTVPAGEFEAFRLLFRNGRAVRTAWVEAAPPHRILRWDNGSSIMELMPE